MGWLYLTTLPTVFEIFLIFHTTEKTFHLLIRRYCTFVPPYG